MSIQTIKDQLRQIREREDYPSLGVKIDLRASRESLKSQLAEAQARIAEQEKEQEGEAKDTEKLSEAVQSLVEEHREAVEDFLHSDNVNLQVINRGEIPCLWTGWDDLEGTPTTNFRSRWERLSIALSRELAYIASKTFPELGIPTGVDSPRLDFRHHTGEGGLPVRECLALYELSDALVSSGFPSQVEEKKYLVNAPSVVQFLESGYANEFPDTGAPSVVGEAFRWLSGMENTFRHEFVELVYLPSIAFQATRQVGELVFQAFLNGDEVEAPPPAEFSLLQGDSIVEVVKKAYWTWLQSILDGSVGDPIRKIETGIETGTHISPDYNYWLAAVILDYHNQPVPQRVREAILSGEWGFSVGSCGRERGFMEYRIVQTALKSYKDDIKDYLDGPRPKAELWHKHLPNMGGNTFKDTDHPALKWEKLNLRLSKELIKHCTAVYGSTTPAEQYAVFSFAYDPDIKQHQLPLLECLALNTLLARKTIFGG